MIISRTPFRISLFGGGTDFPAWFEEHGGACLAATINRYCYISLRKLPPFFAHRYRIVYSRVETVAEISEIQHPAARAILQDSGIEVGLEVHHDADLPARAGMGSFSAFTAGLVTAVDAFRGKVVSRQDLARRIIRLQHEVLQEPIGWQDQVSAAYGGLNRLVFHPGGRFEVLPVALSPERTRDLEEHLVLVFTGVSRDSLDLARISLERYPECGPELRRIRELVDEGHAVLTTPGRPLEELGPLLDESWRCRRAIFGHTVGAEIDAVYAAGLEAGALGGNLLGAGGGGFLLFLVPAAARERFRKRMEDRVMVPVGLEHTGSKVVLYQPDGLGA